MQDSTKSQTIKLIKSSEVVLEVVDEYLFVNTLIHQSEQWTQKQKFILGEDFNLHRWPHGIVLYRGKNVYYLDKEWVLKNIIIPSEFSSDIQWIYNLANIFEKKGIFVLYKEPESKNKKWLCFIYNTKNHKNITLKTDHSFHSLIISDIKNLDFFLKDTLRWELRISANNRVNKIPIKTIIRHEKRSKSFSAVLWQLEYQFLGDFILTNNGGSQQMIYNKNQITKFQHQYKIQYDQTTLDIMDINKHITYKLQLPVDFNLHQVLISPKGNFFCILQSIKSKQLAISRSHLDYLKPDQWFENIMMLEYNSLRVANIWDCSINTQQLAFIGKKQNCSREFVVLQVDLTQKSFFSYPIQVHELAGELHIEYKDNIYKVNSLKMPRTKHAPTLLEYYYFQVDPQAKQNQIQAQKHREINKQVEKYRIALQKWELDYVLMWESHKKLQWFVSEIEIFIDQFQLWTTKTVLGRQREFIDFDPKRVIELYKKIKTILESHKSLWITFDQTGLTQEFDKKKIS